MMKTFKNYVQNIEFRPTIRDVWKNRRKHEELGKVKQRTLSCHKA